MKYLNRYCHALAALAGQDRELADSEAFARVVRDLVAGENSVANFMRLRKYLANPTIKDGSMDADEDDFPFFTKEE